MDKPYLKTAYEEELEQEISKLKREIFRLEASMKIPKEALSPNFYEPMDVSTITTEQHRITLCGQAIIRLEGAKIGSNGIQCYGCIKVKEGEYFIEMFSPSPTCKEHAKHLLVDLHKRLIEKVLKDFQNASA